MTLASNHPNAGAAPGFLALFEGEGLPSPPVPARLAASMRPCSGAWFATRPVEIAPYNLEHFLHEVEADPAMPDYALAGFDGYGVNSWAAHCYVVSGAAALFIQLPWGGAYLEPEPAKTDIADLFGWADGLQSQLQTAVQRGKIPAGWRLQVSASLFGQSGWRWLVAGRDNSAVPWTTAAGMRTAIQQMMDEVLAGKRALRTG
jgi:hypothetical protein